MSIRVLPKSTSSQITSGQIVTSVASVVKELMENALDAGADNVEVKLEECGLSLIQVGRNFPSRNVIECSFHFFGFVPLFFWLTRDFSNED